MNGTPVDAVPQRKQRRLKISYSPTIATGLPMLLRGVSL